MLRFPLRISPYIWALRDFNLRGRSAVTCLTTSVAHNTTSSEPVRNWSDTITTISASGITFADPKPEIPTATASRLVTIAESAHFHGLDELRLWHEILLRAKDVVTDLSKRHILRLLHCFAEQGIKDSEAVSTVAAALLRDEWGLSPLDITSAILSLEATHVRPKRVYVSLFKGIIRQAHAMYPGEVVELFRCFARTNLKPSAVLEALMRTATRNMMSYRYAETSTVCGCIEHLEVDSPSSLAVLKSHQNEEIQMMSPQEMMDQLIATESCEYATASGLRALTQGIKTRTESFSGGCNIDELDDPFTWLSALASRSILTESFLRALAHWCAVAAWRQPTRSQKRPTPQQLLVLFQRLKNMGIEKDANLIEAIRIFVKTKGGMEMPGFRPIEYKPGREYYPTQDDDYDKNISKALNEKNGKLLQFRTDTSNQKTFLDELYELERIQGGRRRAVVRVNPNREELQKVRCRSIETFREEEERKKQLRDTATRLNFG